MSLATLHLVNGRQRSEPSQSEVREHLKAWIQHFMRDLGLTTHESFADTIHVARETITNILNDKRPTGLQVLYKMHFHLGAQHGVTMERMVYSHPSEAHTTVPARAPAKK